VTVVEAAEDWRPAFAAARKASRSGRVIIESFIRGIEYTVETFAHRGTSWVLAISEKRKVPGTRETVALELATPALPRDVSTSIGQFACEALAALGYTDGPGHTEILRDKAGALWLVEAAGRGGGFMVADGIVPRASGFDIARATVLQAVGLEPPTPSNAEPVAFALRFLPSTPGVVTGMSGFERANALDNVECGPLVSLGNHVGMPDTDGARLAYILAWANDRETAVERADRAEALLRIEISPCPPRKS
jgi:biotin carboxylase